MWCKQRLQGAEFKSLKVSLAHRNSSLNPGGSYYQKSQSILESVTVNIGWKTPTPDRHRTNTNRGTHVDACWQCTVTVQAFACLWNVGLNVNGKTQTQQTPRGKGLARGSNPFPSCCQATLVILLWSEMFAVFLRRTCAVTAFLQQTNTHWETFV